MAGTTTYYHQFRADEDPNHSTKSSTPLATGRRRKGLGSFFPRTKKRKEGEGVMFLEESMPTMPKGKRKKASDEQTPSEEDAEASSILMLLANNAYRNRDESSDYAHDMYHHVEQEAQVAEALSAMQSTYSLALVSPPTPRPTGQQSMSINTLVGSETGHGLSPKPTLKQEKVQEMPDWSRKTGARHAYIAYSVWTNGTSSKTAISEHTYKPSVHHSPLDYFSTSTSRPSQSSSFHPSSNPYHTPSSTSLSGFANASSGPSFYATQPDYPPSQAYVATPPPSHLGIGREHGHKGGISAFESTAISNNTYSSSTSTPHPHLPPSSSVPHDQTRVTLPPLETLARHHPPYSSHDLHTPYESYQGPALAPLREPSPGYNSLPASHIPPTPSATPPGTKLPIPEKTSPDTSIVDQSPSVNAVA
ncbi:hypothetical protein BZG36_02342 [Bifiguratus adelaidae]|uniref:Uncharacterized protein n=1 Tax=Bifiguratus adelaidae TaxID=1938954 RepID=A0A261Y2J4_9FUNG|nr:hypothetical protein BZG36_02342 [Bifiguratus adelaidae]